MGANGGMVGMCFKLLTEIFLNTLIIVNYTMTYTPFAVWKAPEAVLGPFDNIS